MCIWLVQVVSASTPPGVINYPVSSSSVVLIHAKESRSRGRQTKVFGFAHFSYCSSSTSVQALL